MRRLRQLIFLLALLGGPGGCFVPGGYGGYGRYGPSYPAYGFAPYAYGFHPYAPVFTVHHPWEEHHALGHPGSFAHAPARVAHGAGEHGDARR